MVNLVIFGASTLGEIALEIAEKSGFKCLGFYDDVNKNDSFCKKPMLGNKADLLRCCKSNDMKIFVAIGDNSSRNTIVNELKTAKASFANIIDPQATIMPSAKLQTGNLIHAHAYIGTKVNIGAHNIIFPGVSITHHNQVKDFCFFSPNASVGGYTTIDSFCKIGMNSVVKPYQSLPLNTQVAEGSVF